MSRRSQIFLSAGGGIVTHLGGVTTNAGFGSSDSRLYTYNPITDGCLSVRVVAASPVTSMTYGGVSLNLAVKAEFGSSGAEIWEATVEKDGISTGLNTLAISISGTENGWIYRIDTWDEVDQDNPFSSTNSVQGNASISNLSQTILENGMAIDCCGVDLFGGGTLTLTGSQTSQFNQDDGFIVGAGGYFPSSQGAGSKTFEWDWSGTDQRSHVTGALQPN